MNSSTEVEMKLASADTLSTPELPSPSSSAALVEVISSIKRPDRDRGRAAHLPVGPVAAQDGHCRSAEGLRGRDSEEGRDGEVCRGRRRNEELREGHRAYGLGRGVGGCRAVDGGVEAGEARAERTGVIQPDRHRHNQAVGAGRAEGALDHGQRGRGYQPLDHPRQHDAEGEGSGEGESDRDGSNATEGRAAGCAAEVLPRGEAAAVRLRRFPVGHAGHLLEERGLAVLCAVPTAKRMRFVGLSAQRAGCDVGMPLIHRKTDGSWVPAKPMAQPTTHSNFGLCGLTGWHFVLCLVVSCCLGNSHTHVTCVQTVTNSARATTSPTD
eukprot:scaffold27785_cov108-Isochrysis_galbana.AAC.2